MNDFKITLEEALSHWAKTATDDELYSMFNSIGDQLADGPNLKELQTILEIRSAIRPEIEKRMGRKV